MRKYEKDTYIVIKEITSKENRKNLKRAILGGLAFAITGYGMMYAMLYAMLWVMKL
jgi:hypothetical protein